MKVKILFYIKIWNFVNTKLKLYDKISFRLFYIEFQNVLTHLWAPLYTYKLPTELG